MRILSYLSLALCLAACSGEPPTFSRDVAPILYENCVACHRPGESGPFPLLTYEDASDRARLIAEVTSSGYMPPWQPDPKFGQFVGARGLTQQQIDVLHDWASTGTAQGDPMDLPPLPDWQEGWQLGEPDLIVEMPLPYTLPASGGDVFRNFVVPLPGHETLHVRALELRPGNPQVVHHAVLMTDTGGAATRQDAQDPEPGFDGMEVGGLERPGGHFLGWAPGAVPYSVPDSLAWTLKPGADLVLQMHMLPSGKPEPIQARVGLHFSDTPPTRTPLLLRLGRRDIDIPAGEAEYEVVDSYTLPADVEVLSVFPHAHYLGRSFEAWALLPDNERQWLIRIDDWNFDWQDAYRYVRPVPLPRGTTVHLRIVYDNSADNERNPYATPRRIRYGTRSEDEMGDLILQVLPRREADGVHIRRHYARHWLQQEMDGYRSLLAADPDNADHHHVLGVFHLSSGDGASAARHLQQAVRLRPDFPEAHLNLATVLLRAKRPGEAEKHLRQALRLRPEFGDAHLNLGMLLGQSGRLEEAIQHLKRGAELRPDLAPDVETLLRRLGRR